MFFAVFLAGLGALKNLERAAPSARQNQRRRPPVAKDRLGVNAGTVRVRIDTHRDGQDAGPTGQNQWYAAPFKVTLPVPELITHVTVRVVVLPAVKVNV